jgi:hypothetical protein
MTHHPHVHMIVPGGGFSLDGKRPSAEMLRIGCDPQLAKADADPSCIRFFASCPMPNFNCAGAASWLSRGYARAVEQNRFRTR